jgi:membrane-associated phospholipid phosphatase
MSGQMETASVRVPPGPSSLDLAVMRRWPSTHRFPMLDWVAVRLSQAGEVSAVWFVITGLAAALVLNSTREAVVLALGLIVEWLLTNRVVKRYVWRARPTPECPDPRGVRRPSSSSLPSGHSSASAFAAVAVGWTTGWLLPMSVLAFLLGCSRFHLRVHYPTDVMAGWAWGALLGSGALMVFW